MELAKDLAAALLIHSVTIKDEDVRNRFDDAEEELKRMEEFRKAQAEMEKKIEKPMSQKIFKVV